MKLTIVGQDFAGGQGVDYVTASTARMFAKIGWDVDVLVSQVHADYLKEGKKAFELPGTAKLIYMPSRRARCNGLFLRRYLKTCRADFVIAESGAYAWAIRWASFGISKKCLPKIVQVDHGNTDVIRGRGRLRRCIKYWFLYSKFHALFFVNDESNKNFRKMYGFLRHLKTATVNNACIDGTFLKKILMSPTHPWLVRKKCTTLVSAGAYQPYKDHIVILKALKIVKEQGCTIRVVIFGRGPLEGVYRKFITENKLEDYVDVGVFSNCLPAEIHASDGFILSSNCESFGIVLVEGLASGVPCIATDAHYGPREILAGGKYGRIVPVNDPMAMAKAMIDLSNGKISSAPKESWERYSMERTLRKYLAGLGI